MGVNLFPCSQDPALFERRSRGGSGWQGMIDLPKGSGRARQFASLNTADVV